MFLMFWQLFKFIFKPLKHENFKYKKEKPSYFVQSNTLSGAFDSEKLSKNIDISVMHFEGRNKLIQFSTLKNSNVIYEQKFHYDYDLLIIIYK